MHLLGQSQSMPKRHAFRHALPLARIRPFDFSHIVDFIRGRLLFQPSSSFQSNYLDGPQFNKIIIWIDIFSCKLLLIISSENYLINKKTRLLLLEVSGFHVAGGP